MTATSPEGLWHWIHPGKRRWYTVLLQQDLFGDWVLIRAWGSLDSQRGGERRTLLPHPEDAAGLLNAITHQRKRHGYQMQTPKPPGTSNEALHHPAKEPPP